MGQALLWRKKGGRMKPESDERVEDLADRIERAGDRYDNAGNYQRANESRIAAKAIRESAEIGRAREIFRTFEAGNQNRQNGVVELTSESRPPRRPWWKWWRSTRTDDS